MAAARRSGWGRHEGGLGDLNSSENHDGWTPHEGRFFLSFEDPASATAPDTLVEAMPPGGPRASRLTC